MSPLKDCLRLAMSDILDKEKMGGVCDWRMAAHNAIYIRLGWCACQRRGFRSSDGVLSTHGIPTEA
jgi:hypothetical protein